MGHYSPLVSEDTVEIKEGDIVKIDLGVHVDGYIAVVAHTLARPALPRSAPRGAPQLGMYLAHGAGGRLWVARRTLEELPRRSEPCDSPRHEHLPRPISWILGPRLWSLSSAGLWPDGRHRPQGRRAAGCLDGAARGSKAPSACRPALSPCGSRAAAPQLPQQLPGSYPAATPQLARS